MSADRKVGEEPLLPCTAWVRLSHDGGGCFMAGGVVSGDRMYTTPSCRSGTQHAPLEGISLINNEVVSITVQYPVHPLLSLAKTVSRATPRPAARG